MANKKKAYPKIYLGESFVDQRVQAMFGTSDYTKLSKKQKKRLDDYLTSDAGRKDAATFRQQDQRKVNESLDAWKAVNAHNHAIDMAAWRDHLNKRYPLTAQITPPVAPPAADPLAVNPLDGDPPAADPAAVQEVKPPKKVVTQADPAKPDALAAAKELGFNSIDELKAFQKKVGLTEDGVVTDDLKARQAWYKYMSGLGYQEGADQHGQAWFSNDGKMYYNNGRMQASDGAMSNYDYKTLTAAKPLITLQQLWDSGYFRKHYNYSGETVKIGNEEYPLLVTTGLLGSGLNVTNDHSYVFDPVTGKIRKLRETWTGNIQAFRDPEFAQDSEWIDVQPILDYKKAPVQSQSETPYNVGGRQSYLKLGGTMNRIKYFQQGGAAQQGAQDVQQQVIALVQAAMQGDEKANQTVTQIMEAAKAGDQQAMQLAQLIQEVAKQMQGQATTAKWGAKLGYIRSLKYAQGGKACPACEKGAPIKVEEKACGGKAKKAKKRYFGGWL